MTESFQAGKRHADPGSGRAPRPAASGAGLTYEDFDRPLPTPEPEVIEPTFSLAEVEAARAEGVQEGRSAAAAEAQQADHAAIRRTLTDLATQLAGARAMLEEQAEQSATAIAQLLLHCLGAVMPQLAQRYGEAELKSMVRAILPGLFQEPAVTVRLNPRHAAAITHEIEQFDPDLAVRIRVLPTATIPPGDLRIAWTSGGATRDGAALWAQVLETLAGADLAPVAALEPAEREAATQTKQQEAAAQTREREAATPTRELEAATPTRELEAAAQTREREAATQTEQQEAATPTRELEAAAQTREREAATPTREREAATQTRELEHAG